jgi:hypothetical protein
MILRFALVILVSLLCSCASTYKSSALSVPTTKLERGKFIAIALPTNGSYGGKEYAGSGSSTATAIRAAFAKYARETVVTNECQGLTCLIERHGQTADYLVVPEILRWEDRATEWSGIKDTLEIKIAVYDASSGKELAATTLLGKSKWASFGGDHPQDLLPEPVNQYVANLY